MNRWLARLLRLPLLARLAAWILVHMNFALPLQRLRETDILLAFHHPRPAYALHIVIVPKRAIPNLAGLTPADDPFLAELFRTVQSLVLEFKPPAYRLIVNGGQYQDFPQLHFHLIADRG